MKTCSTTGLKFLGGKAPVIMSNPVTFKLVALLNQM